MTQSLPLLYTPYKDLPLKSLSPINKFLFLIYLQLLYFTIMKNIQKYLLVFPSLDNLRNCEQEVVFIISNSLSHI